MKEFILYILKIVAVFVLGFLLLEQVYDRVFANGIIRSKLQKVLSLEEGDYSEYVFLGSSRTENNIDCEIIEELTGKSCINLGISGSTLQDSYVLLKLLIENGVTLEHVFVQVDYSYNENEAKLSPAFKATLIPYRKIPAIREELIQEEDGPFILNFPFYGYLKYEKVIGIREIFNQLIRNETGRNYDNGFLPLTGNGKKLYGSLPSEVAEKNMTLLKMDQLISKNDENLYYFFAPYCSEVKNRDYAVKLQKKLPGMFNYVSLFDSKEEFYVDCGHLNITGAKKFTKIFIEDFLRR